MKVVLLGHSHTEAIMAAVAGDALGDLKTLGGCAFEHVYLKREPFHGLLRDAHSQLTVYGRAVRDHLATADAAVLSLEGGWHESVGMMERRQRYDFFGETTAASIGEDRQIIPRSVMTQVLVHRMESPTKSAEGVLRSSFVEVLAFVREQLTCPCVLLESPPPIPDAEKIARFRSVAGAGEQGVTPLPIRLKLWRLQCKLMGQYCDGAGIDYLPVPAAAFSTDGTLDPRAYEGVNDPTHMSVWYGRHVIRQIDAWMGASQRRGVANGEKREFAK